MASQRPVGVFDSGVGGVSVLNQLRRELPGEDFIYYGDTANAPYGTKPEADIMRCAGQVMDHLLSEGVKSVVIACNTASAVAAQALREKHDLPIVAMEPALKPASAIRREGSVLVLATPVTLRLPKFQRLYSLYGEGAIPVPCPGLMELVEAMDWPRAARYLSDLLSGFALDKVDALVLGCTHYVFLRPLLRELLPARIAVVDGNAGTARQLRHVLTERGLLADRAQGSVRLQTSGSPAEVIPVMERLMAAAGEQ